MKHVYPAAFDPFLVSPVLIRAMYEALYWNAHGDTRQSYRERADGMRKQAKRIVDAITKEIKSNE